MGGIKKTAMITLGIVKKYGKKTVLNLENVNLEDGKKYALVGANGSGKSTLIKLLAKEEKPSAGKIAGVDKKDVAYMPQNSVGFACSVAKNVKLAIPDLKRFDLKNNHIVYSRAYEIIDKLGLWSLRHKNGATLSGGETERMALARVLVVDHDILLLDEPTAAMDVEAAGIAEKVIEEYQQKTHCTLIFATHSLKQAERLADEVIFLHEGEIVERGKAAEVLHNATDERTKAFLDFAN